MQVKKEEKKSKILEAALELFSVRPFEEVTTGMIANASHVGKGTLYTYFKSKEDILGEGILLVMEEFLHAAIEVHNSSGTLEEKIRMLFESYYRISSNRQGVWTVFTKIYTDNRLNERRIELQSRMKSEIEGIFKPFEDRLYVPIDQVVDFIVVNIMPFGIKIYSENFEYWQNTIKIITKGIKKD